MRSLLILSLVSIATAQDHTCDCAIFLDTFDLGHDYFLMKFEDLGTHHTSGCDETELAACLTRCEAEAAVIDVIYQNLSAIYPGSDPRASYGEIFCERIWEGARDFLPEDRYVIRAEYEIRGPSCPPGVVWDTVGVSWEVCCDSDGEHEPCDYMD